MKLPMGNLNAYVASSKAYAKKDYNTKEVVVDEDGNNFYPLRVYVLDGEDNSEARTITVKSKENPFAELKPFTPVVFTDVVYTSGEYNGKPYQKFSAAKVKKA